MRYLKSAALFVAAMLGVVTPALAGVAGVIKTTVTPLSSNVTYRTDSLVTHVGYTVTVENIGGNTANNVRFTASAAVADAQESAQFSPGNTDGASCSTTANPQGAPVNAVTIGCSLGQMRAGALRSFAVFFLAPMQDTVSPLAEGADKVNFSGVTYYSEGSNDTSDPNDATQWASGDVLLGTNNPTLVRSALPKIGGHFFTGNGAVTTSGDPFAVAVTVPQAPTFSAAEVLESDISSNISCSSLGHFVKCYQSAITIPDIVFSSSSGSYLTIVLRVDASNIKPGTKIGDVLIQYDDGSNVYNVGACASPTTPGTDGIPCIAKAVYYKSKSVPGWTPDLDGDFEWTLLNLKNGALKLF